MFIVGLTGGIGTGKSTVSGFFKDQGIPVIDADTMARKVVEPGKKAWKAIKKEFGDSVFQANGELNREALGDLIFNDIEKRKKLNQITHTEIYKEMIWAALTCLFQGHQYIVMDLPLLYETRSMLSILHKVIVVTCEKDQQLERVIKRGSGMTEERARLRIEAQMPLEKKCEEANIVLDNSGSVEGLKKQVDNVIVLLKDCNTHWKLRVSAIFCIAALGALIYWLLGGSFSSIKTSGEL